MSAALIPTNILLAYLLTVRVSALSFTNAQTLVKLNYGDKNAFTFIQEDRYRPGVLIAFLTHSIVEIHLNNPPNMKLIAGAPDVAGYSDGTGAGIRFNNPWDLVQLSETSWLISDNGNNCLRDFNGIVNRNRNRSSIATWSRTCNSEYFQSVISDLVRDSMLYSPRGLAYMANENKVFVTYEEPYSLAEIDLSSHRVRVRYSNHKLKLRRIIPLGSEVILSTDPPILLLSYKGSNLKEIVNNDWQDSYRIIDDALYTSGVAYIGNDVFIQSVNNSNILLLVNRQEKKISAICTGYERYKTRAETLGNCLLSSPRYVAYINDTLYIGESGHSGGGIVAITVTHTTGMSSTLIGILSAALLLLLAILIVIGRCFMYRKKNNAVSLRKKSTGGGITKTSVLGSSSAPSSKHNTESKHPIPLNHIPKRSKTEPPSSVELERQQSVASELYYEVTPDDNTRDKEGIHKLVDETSSYLEILPTPQDARNALSRTESYLGILPIETSDKGLHDRIQKKTPCETDCYLEISPSGKPSVCSQNKSAEDSQ